MCDGSFIEWNFYHLPKYIETLLKKYPNRDVFVYASLQGAQSTDKAPVMHIITLPSGRTPTQILAEKSTSDGDTEEFCTFDDAYYQWVQFGNPSFKGRAYHLKFDAESNDGDEDDGDFFEGASLLLMTLRDTLQVYFEERVQRHFANLAPEEKAGARERIKEVRYVSRTAVNRTLQLPYVNPIYLCLSSFLSGCSGRVEE